MRAERDAGGVITTTMMAKNKKPPGIRTVVNDLMTAGFSNDCARFTGNAAGRGRGGRSLILACRLLCRESGGEWHVLESGRGEGQLSGQGPSVRRGRAGCWGLWVWRGGGGQDRNRWTRPGRFRREDPRLHRGDGGGHRRLCRGGCPHAGSSRPPGPGALERGRGESGTGGRAGRHHSRADPYRAAGGSAWSTTGCSSPASTNDTMVSRSAFLPM